MPNNSVEDEAQEFEQRGHREDKPLSIGQLNWYLKNVIEQAAPKVWVEGEVSDLSRPSSGHLYFTLKDEGSQIRAVIWRSQASRLRFKLADGQSVVCCGAVEVYPPRGSYQLIINQLQPKGVGPLQLAFEQLHKKLSSAGLFDPDRKKPIPSFPRRIGFVTSPSGAALHDFIEASRERWSDFELTVIPARVQGEQAAQDIVAGIQAAQRLRPNLDVLVIGRGGGSIEDLWCFNEESVVRAICGSKIPTVSAVGHEIDVTLSDLAADVRALTPTHAAALVFRSKADLVNRIQQIDERLHNAVRRRGERLRQRLDALTERGILAHPHELYLHHRQEIDEIEASVQKTMRDLIATKREKLVGLTRAADALSPLNVLSRGYSLTHVQKTAQPLTSSDHVEVGDLIETTLAYGSLVSRVEERRDAE